MSKKHSRNSQSLLSCILKIRERVRIDRDTSYGANVLPVLELYKGLTSFEERKAFQDALEKMLSDPDKEIRRYAVTVCLGFFVFRDVV